MKANDLPDEEIVREMWLKVEMWPINKLKRYGSNPRVHPKAQIERIAQSILEFGFVAPILVDETGTIIAGDGRIAAAHLLNYSKVPIIQVSHLTSDQVKAYRIVDNRMMELGGWDEALLANEIEVLIQSEFDIEKIGYNESEIEAMTKNWPENPIDPEKEWEGMPEYKEEPALKPLRTLTVSFYEPGAIEDFCAKLNIPVPYRTGIQWPTKEDRPGQEYYSDES